MRFESQPLKVRSLSRQSGSALIYILIAVALLAALTVSLMEPSNQQAQTQSTTNLVSSVDSQIKFITSAVQECVLTHPDQDAKVTQTPSPASVSTQRNPPYPINPKDPFYTAASATPGVATTDQASEIRCPGNPGGNSGVSQNHAKIFGGSSGKFMPQPPPLFSNWRYYNGSDGVFIMIASDKTDAYIQAALTRLDGMYSNCEAEIFNRLNSAGALNVSSDTTPGDGAVKACANNTICFRYWIKRTSSAVPVDAACN